MSVAPRRPVASTLCALMLVGGVGCAPSVVSRPPPAAPPTPVTEPIPAPILAPVMRYAIPGQVADTRYRLTSTTALERDSAGRRDTQQLSGEAQVVVRLRRRSGGGFSATGQVIGYAVQSALSTTAIAIDSLRFDAVLDSLALRVALQPPLVNECDRPESGALSLVRDLLIRVPASLAIGDQWRDSTVALVCRSNLPMIVRTVADYVVTDSAHGDEGVLLVIRRTSHTRVEGKVSSPWRSVSVTGIGSATLEARVSVKSGAVERVESTSTLTLAVSDRTTPASVRAQQVIQRVQLTGVKVAR